MKNYVVHPNIIRKILKDAKFSMATSYPNGRIRGLISSNGDISLGQWNDGNNNIFTEIHSRKGNLNKAIKVIKKAGFNIKLWKHPSGLITRTLITN